MILSRSRIVEGWALCLHVIGWLGVRGLQISWKFNLCETHTHTHTHTHMPLTTHAQRESEIERDSFVIELTMMSSEFWWGMARVHANFFYRESLVKVFLVGFFTSRISLHFSSERCRSWSDNYFNLCSSNSISAKATSIVR